VKIIKIKVSRADLHDLRNESIIFTAYGHLGRLSGGFQLFLSKLKAKAIELMEANWKELSALCGQFGFKLENSLHQPDEIESCDHPYRQ
jgi:hypothetical protein